MSYLTLSLLCKLIVNTTKHRVIHKSLRDFRPLRYSSRDGHPEVEYVNRGTDTHIFCPNLQLPHMLHVCGRNLITEFISAPSPSIDISSNCKIGQKIGVSLSLSVDMLHFVVTIPATLPQRSEIPEVLMNYPVYKYP